MRYLIDFSYAGESFNGYQRQPKKRTVEEEIEKVLTNINGGKKVIIHSSGRTDKGVNALHQKAHFDFDKKLTEYKLLGALNSYLPEDIHINEVLKVDDNFHARYMVKSKTYLYKLNMGDYSPLLRTHVYQYCKPLNIRNMKKAIKYFKGTHDFTSFIKDDDKKENKIRTIYKANIRVKDNIVYIIFNGNGFLKYQVRNMVGALIKVGEEKLDANSIKNIMESKDRKKASICAPANGLTLIDVSYKK